MRDLALRLMGMRCLDGVELVHRDTYPDIKSPYYGASGPDWFSYRSARYKQEIVRNAVDLEDPLVVRFINAIDDDKRIAFLSRFGLPENLIRIAGIGPSGTEPRNLILGRQRILRRLLEDAGSGDATCAIKAANESLRHAGAHRLSLEPGGRMVSTTRNLMDFMYMEIAIVAANGARLATCKRCRDFFLTGALTKRRSTAKYCRDLCRVGAHRANKRNRKGG
jgi:hypothetical protein